MSPSTLTQASHQWATRPDDERYVSLYAMGAHFRQMREESQQVVAPNRTIEVVPVAGDMKGLQVADPAGGDGFDLTHWSFGQLCGLTNAPAGWLRTMPSPYVADGLNISLRFKREVEDIGLLLRVGSEGKTLRAATGPTFGRVWNSDLVERLIALFGNGLDGHWRVPGEFGKDIVVTKQNTTLFGSDRDMFVFLADEHRKVEIKDRRNGTPGLMSRGFFLKNSEVGGGYLESDTFYFDHACCNRIVWGVEGFKTVKIRHTAGAPLRFVEEIQPVLEAYANGPASRIEEAVAAAKKAKLDKDLDEFLAERFSKNLVPILTNIHQVEEQRPIETLWDVATAASAYARSIPRQDDRVEIERKAGAVLDLVRVR